MSLDSSTNNNFCPSGDIVFFGAILPCWQTHDVSLDIVIDPFS